MKRADHAVDDERHLPCPEHCRLVRTCPECGHQRKMHFFAQSCDDCFTPVLLGRQFWGTVGQMRRRGYSDEEIAKRLGVDVGKVRR